MKDVKNKKKIGKCEYSNIFNKNQKNSNRNKY